MFDVTTALISGLLFGAFLGVCVSAVAFKAIAYAPVRIEQTEQDK